MSTVRLNPFGGRLKLTVPTVILWNKLLEMPSKFGTERDRTIFLCNESGPARLVIGLISKDFERSALAVFTSLYLPQTGIYIHRVALASVCDKQVLHHMQSLRLQLSCLHKISSTYVGSCISRQRSLTFLTLFVCQLEILCFHAANLFGSLPSKILLDSKSLRRREGF